MDLTGILGVSFGYRIIVFSHGMGGEGRTTEPELTITDETTPSNGKLFNLHHSFAKHTLSITLLLLRQSDQNL